MRTRSRLYLTPLVLPRWHRNTTNARSPPDLLTLIYSDMQTYAAVSPSREALTATQGEDIWQSQATLTPAEDRNG